MQPAKRGMQGAQERPPELSFSRGERLWQRKLVSHKLSSICVSGAGSPGLLLAWSPGPRRSQRASCRSPDLGGGAGRNLLPDVRASRDRPEPRDRPLQHASTKGPEGRGNQGEEFSRADPALDLRSRGRASQSRARSAWASESPPE